MLRTQFAVRGSKVMRNLEHRIDAKTVGVIAVLVAGGDHQEAVKTIPLDSRLPNAESEILRNDYDGTSPGILKGAVVDIVAGQMQWTCEYWGSDTGLQILNTGLRVS